MWFTPDKQWRKIQREACYCANWRSGLPTGDPVFLFEPCEADVTLIKVTYKPTGTVIYKSALGLVRELYGVQPQNASVILETKDFHGTEEWY